MEPDDLGAASRKMKSKELRCLDFESPGIKWQISGDCLGEGRSKRRRTCHETLHSLSSTSRIDVSEYKLGEYLAWILNYMLYSHAAARMAERQGRLRISETVSFAGSNRHQCSFDEDRNSRKVSVSHKCEDVDVKPIMASSFASFLSTEI